MIPGQVHRWHFEGEVYGYIVHFNEVLFTTFFQNGHYLDRFYFFQGNAEDGICQLPVPVQSHVSSLFEAMLDELEESKEQNLDIIRLKLLELFITVDRSCTSRKSKNVARQKHTPLRSFQRLINKHFHTIRLPKEYADLLLGQIIRFGLVSQACINLFSLVWFSGFLQLKW